MFYACAYVCVCMKETKSRFVHVQKKRKENNQLAGSISMSVVGGNVFFDVAAVTSGFFNVSKSSTTTTTDFFQLPACFLFVFFFF